MRIRCKVVFEFDCELEGGETEAEVLDAYMHDFGRDKGEPSPLCGLRDPDGDLEDFLSSISASQVKQLDFTYTED